MQQQLWAYNVCVGVGRHLTNRNEMLVSGSDSSCYITRYRRSEVFEDGRMYSTAT